MNEYYITKQENTHKNLIKFANYSIKLPIINIQRTKQTHTKAKESERRDI